MLCTSLKAQTDILSLSLKETEMSVPKTSSRLYHTAMLFSFPSVIPMPHVNGSSLKECASCPACSSFSNRAFYIQYPLGACWDCV